MTRKEWLEMNADGDAQYVRAIEYHTKRLNRAVSRGDYQAAQPILATITKLVTAARAEQYARNLIEFLE